MNMLGGVGGKTETEREGEIDNAEHGGNRNWRKEQGGAEAVKEGGARMKWPLRFFPSTERRGSGIETPINDKASSLPPPLKFHM